MSDGYQIPLPHLLSLIRERRYPAIAFRQVRVARVVTQIPQTRLQRIPPRMLAQHQRARRHADGLRRNNLVGQRILDDAILMDARFMSEGVRAHDGLVRRYLRTGDFGEQAAGREKLIELDVGGYAEALFAYR